ncbi:uncharacterized protein LOC123517717 isoform X2 [Portunus trituberculatus]|nr:uncharacterized protein LOC123517717 isoform X2 [Portunus trituberculatus]
MWEDRSPSHPRLRFAAIRTPMAAATPPQLRDNSLLLGETCHARHLHTCGGRVIEEFSHEPDYSDACRIREEFLDCMEKEQKEPCRLQGSYFTQTGTRRIIGRIKKLLWSARGCILGHSP